MRATIAMLALSAAVGLLAAGCGGSKKSTTTSTTTTTATSTAAAAPLSKAAYVAQVKAVGKDLSAAITALGNPKTAPVAAAGLTTLQADLRSAVQKLNAIKPPANVAAAHAQLASAVTEFADELSPIIAKLKAGNMKAYSQILTLKGLADITRAAQAITKAGYPITSS
jgi:hypothetical protein